MAMNAARPKYEPRLESSRTVAAQIVYEVLENQRLFDEALESHEGFARLTVKDRRLAYHLAAGVVKYKRRLDYIARHYLQEKFDRLPAIILSVLRVGLFQLSVSERIPTYAAVSETVEVARRLGHGGTAGLVNAILRRFAGAGPDDRVLFPSRETERRRFLAEWYSYPDWLVDLFCELGGEERAEEFCRWGNREPAFTLRINPLKTDVAGLLHAAEAEHTVLEPMPEIPGYYRWQGAGGPSRSSAILQKGMASVQNASAGLVVRLLDPQPGETIMDLFAAPGGKSGAIAELQRDSGRVLAVDASTRRLAKVIENKERLGLASILPISGNVLCLPVHGADRVLADVPCSALGTLPKNPDARWQKSPADIARLSEEQFQYLTSAAAQVRDGGVLVYATCTITHQENRSVVGRFLARNPLFALESAVQAVDSRFVDSEGFLSVRDPGSGLDLVFAARLRKRR